MMVLKAECVDFRSAFLSQPKDTSTDDTTGKDSQIIYLLITSVFWTYVFPT